MRFFLVLFCPVISTVLTCECFKFDKESEVMLGQNRNTNRTVEVARLL